MTFRLFSEDFQEGGKLPLANVFNGYGHQGENRSPQLSWTGAPEGTKSFVLTMRDPDVPTVAGLWHWIVVDIPADATRIDAGAGSGAAQLPAGARQTRTDVTPSGYAGAAPPPGPAHRYNFTLYALSVDKLPVPDDPSGAMVDMMANINKIGEARLTATYGG